MAQTELQVASRSELGKGAARSLRREGLLPGVVYGKGMEPCPVTVSPRALEKAVASEAGWNTLMTLKGDGSFDGKVVILKDMQLDPIRREPIHADFQTINLQEKLEVMVPVHPVGNSEGEKIGGSLQLIRKELLVSCLPTAIPKSIDVDVTALKIGDVIHVEDLALPEGVDAPHDANFTVITLIGRKAEEEEVEGEEVEAVVEEAEAAAEE